MPTVDVWWELLKINCKTKWFMAYPCLFSPFQVWQLDIVNLFSNINFCILIMQMYFSLNQSCAVVQLDLCKHKYKFSFSYIWEKEVHTIFPKFCECSKALFKWIFEMNSRRPPRRKSKEGKRDLSNLSLMNIILFGTHSFFLYFFSVSVFVFVFIFSPI